jgi:DNA primase
VGYVSGDELIAYVRWRRLPAQAAIRVGLLGRDGREFLAGRVIVPEIRRGEPVWLVGRTIEGNGGGPKYLGLPGAKPLLGWETALGSPMVILVEGVFDWLTLVQWGFPALALVGTRVRPEVLRALGARFERVYLALDADDAGQQAAAAIATALGSRAVTVRLPHGIKDVAELAPRPDGRAVFANELGPEARALAAAA